MSRERSVPSLVGYAFGRSLFPITALVIILGSTWWGPWGTLFIAYGWWRTVAVVG
jgi:hypothetical protein